MAKPKLKSKGSASSSTRSARQKSLMESAQQIWMAGVTSLDVDSVRVFLAVADHHSFTRAADALGTTQGAVSVKLKRLEDQLAQRLIEEYLAVAGHALDAPGPVFRPVKNNRTKEGL